MSRRGTPEDFLGPLNEAERKNAPKELFVAGNEALLHGWSRVAVVGSRKLSAAGSARAVAVASMLVGAGVVVVSGLAEGVDTMAHETAIKEGGRTIAVLGTPLETAYPAKNRELQARIARDHLVISQFPAGYPSKPQNFPMRNRTMALISDATVIVEAAEKSGTIHQGWEALRLGRPLFLMESLVSNNALSWPKDLMSYGAQVLSRGSFDGLCEQLPMRESGGQYTEVSF